MTKELDKKIKKIQSILEHLDTEDGSKCEEFDLVDVSATAVVLRVLGDCGHCKFPELVKSLESKIKKEFPRVKTISYTY